MKEKIYDVAIIGGGVAGLSLSILLAREHKSVILFEKENYPFHKVCGEYISSESFPFLRSLGINLEEYNLPDITMMRLTSYSGISIERPLDIGGTGISRYRLDELLYNQAKKEGVLIHTNTKIQHVNFNDDKFEINCDGAKIQSQIAIGAYGKNSNIDVKLNRTIKAESESNLFIAVKHHIKCDYDKRFVEMHNFNGGYCGMSAIENDKINLSYICKATQLKKYGSIHQLEQELLSENPFLKKYFTKAEFLFSKPLTISHLHFGLKQAVSNHILMLGDAAGNIAPLSGNGMSMAMRSASVSSQLILQFLNGTISRNQLEDNYQSSYHKTFHSRVLMARMINASFGQQYLTNISMSILKHLPFLIDIVSRQIHGETF